VRQYGQLSYPSDSLASCYYYYYAVLPRSLHGLAPSYISDLRRPVTTVGSRQRLRSATRGDLVVCSFVTHFGTHVFAVVGPMDWNQLPMYIRAWETVSSFKAALKPFAIKASSLCSVYDLAANTFLLQHLYSEKYPARIHNQLSGDKQALSTKALSALCKLTLPCSVGHSPMKRPPAHNQYR